MVKKIIAIDRKSGDFDELSAEDVLFKMSTLSSDDIIFSRKI